MNELENLHLKKIELNRKRLSDAIAHNEYFEIIKYASWLVATLENYPERKKELAFAYHQRGVAWGDVGNRRSSLDDIKKAHELDPSHQTWRELACAQDHLEQYEDALCSITKALEGPEDDGDLAFWSIERAGLYEKLGRYKEAIADVEVALHIWTDVEPWPEAAQGQKEWIEDLKKKILSENR